MYEHLLVRNNDPGLERLDLQRPQQPQPLRSAPNLVALAVDIEARLRLPHQDPAPSHSRKSPAARV